MALVIIVLRRKLINNLMTNNLPTAIIIALNLAGNSEFDEDITEALDLTASAGYQVLEVVTLKRPRPDAKLFIGKGKVEEIVTLCNELQPDRIIINHNLSPVQDRNLDRAFSGRQIIDRTQLILDIFAKRVRSAEGILQVELAQQSYLATRLVRRWTHLERQRGGIGLRGGSGEKQIELDRRAITDKIVSLKRRLALIVKQRQTQRKARLNSGVSALSLVGYTNAGKSTLFNAVTNAKVYAEDRLFATLQTTTRQFFLGAEHAEVLLSDTVGFIRDLPTKLIAAFRATLEETIHADLLLHVVDVSIKGRQIAEVNKVLHEIKADQIAQLIVYNKIDLLENMQPYIEYNQMGEPLAVYLSATTKQGLDLLYQAIMAKLAYICKNNLPRLDEPYEPWKH